MSLDEYESLLKDGYDELLFLILRRFFFLSRLFFFDDESDDDGSGSGLSGTCPFSFSENYVGFVIGIFSFSQVNGIFSVNSFEYFHLVKSNLVESNLVE